MDFDPGNRKKTAAEPSLRAAVAPYQRSDLSRSLWQIANSLLPYLLLWALMVKSLAYPYWITLALAVPAAGFLTRIFIIFHDCAHGSFFARQKANDFLGCFLGVLIFTPFFQWRHEHVMHHATSGDLDRRGFQNIDTLTVTEYLGLPAWKRLRYRLLRHPLILLTLGPIWESLFRPRVPFPHTRGRARRNVHWTSLAIVTTALMLSWKIGLESFLLVQLPILQVAGAVAIWTFYCQHQFEGAYWAHHGEWSFESSALLGSSYLRLPGVLQWFTGNVGFHHIHHLSPRVPNYHLAASHRAHPRFQEVPTLTFWSSFRLHALKLWDEERQELVKLRAIRES